MTSRSKLGKLSSDGARRPRFQTNLNTGAAAKTDAKMIRANEEDDVKNISTEFLKISINCKSSISCIDSSIFYELIKGP